MCIAWMCTHVICFSWIYHFTFFLSPLIVQTTIYSGKQTEQCNLTSEITLPRFFLLFSLFLDFFVTRFFSSSISIINWIAHPVDSALCLFIWFFIEKFIYFDSLPISARPGHAPPAPIMNCRSERARTNYIKFRADGVRSPNDWFDKYKTERESILEKSDSTTTIEWREGERETEKSSVVANVLSYCVNANIIANYWSDMHSYTGTHWIQYNPWIFPTLFLLFLSLNVSINWFPCWAVWKMRILFSRPIHCERFSARKLRK